jgi:hypothetical protein
MSVGYQLRHSVPKLRLAGASRISGVMLLVSKSEHCFAGNYRKSGCASFRP